MFEHQQTEELFLTVLLLLLLLATLKKLPTYEEDGLVPKLKNFLPKLMDDLKQYSDKGIDLGRL